MRLFFALWPDANTRARLDHWAATLHRICGGRRTPAENLHATLLFLGKLEEARVTAVEAAAGGVAVPEFTLVLDEPGYWKRNQIAWAGCSFDPMELSAFVLELGNSVRRAGVEADFDAARPFTTHVTLLRDARELRKKPQLEPIHWPVRGFALMSSVMSPTGSRYEIHRAWDRLGHAGAP